MELERLRPMVVRGTFHAYELAALVAAARYVAEAEPEDVPEESLEQLRHLLADYDRQLRNLPLSPAPPGERAGPPPSAEGRSEASRT